MSTLPSAGLMQHGRCCQCNASWGSLCHCMMKRSIYIKMRGFSWGRHWGEWNNKHPALEACLCACARVGVWKRESVREKDGESKNGNPSSRVALWTLGRVIMCKWLLWGFFFISSVAAFGFVAYSHKTPPTVIKEDLNPAEAIRGISEPCWSLRFSTLLMCKPEALRDFLWWWMSCELIVCCF